MAVSNRCFYPGQLLLPREGIHPTTWAVLACDQHTSEPAWWEETALEVGDAPSTLRLPVGQAWTQARQRMHFSPSVARGAAGWMASTGQAPTQQPQRVQVSSPTG